MALRTGGADNLPPPSTLAAQLVVNFSASSRSSRSDENNELRRLSATIQAVERDPDLLKSPEDQLRHNHLLTYVFIRAVLDNIRLEDPLLDPTTLRTEVLKAINFLKLIVKETPHVLGYTQQNGEFDSRGEEPLWIWLFPKLLRFLGHHRCLEASADIEGFFQDLLELLGSEGDLVDLSISMNAYFRQIFNAVMAHVKDLPTTGADVTINQTIPDAGVFELLLGRDILHTIKHSTYVISRATHGIRHMESVVTILVHPYGSTDTAPTNDTMSAQKPWLLDSLLSLRLMRSVWRSIAFPTTQLATLRDTLKILSWDNKEPNHMAYNKAYTVLALHCVDVVQHSGRAFVGEGFDAEENRRILSGCLLQLAHAATGDRNVGRIAASKIVYPLEHMALGQLVHGSWADLLKCLRLLKRACQLPLVDSDRGDIHPGSFTDSMLSNLAEQLDLLALPEKDAEPPSKRRKISSEPDGLVELYGRICEIIGKTQETDNVGLDDALVNALPYLDENSLCLAIDLVSRLGCIADCVEPSQGKRKSVSRCKYCSKITEGTSRPRKLPSKAKADAQSTFIKLTANEAFLASDRPRISAMMSLRRVIAHTDDPDLYALETSELGQWCLKSLQSSMRELRVAAGRTLATFLRKPSSSHIQSDVAARNQKYTLPLLKSITERNILGLSETTIMAWGQVGRAVTGDELNLVLHKLLEYLGGSNSLVSSCAFNEIVNMAAARKISCRKLFEPFWSNLAFFVVKDMIPRPQISRAMAELLQISVNQFLILIQSHALPWLVLTKKKDVVQKIVEARKDTARLALLDSANFGRIIALLLVQDVPDIESFVMARLREFPQFDSCNLAELMKAETVPIVFEVLKTAGDSNEQSKPRVINALTWMCSKIMADNKEFKSRGKKQGGNVVGRFLEHYMLGLMARLADVINDRLPTSSPVEEQLRCLRAMEEMIKVCKAYVRIARPQISACLLSVLAHDNLRRAAFSCWMALMTKMEEEDVEILIEPTFFIINYYWTLFDDETMQMVKDLILALFNQYGKVLQATIHKLPRLEHIPFLKDVEKKLAELREPLDSKSTFAFFAERLSHQNSGVVQQALTELIAYLQDNQSYLQTSAISEQPDTVVPTLIRSLLDCTAKYSISQIEIANLSTQCLGLVGCLDSNRIETTRKQRSMVVLGNFTSSDETTDFVLFLLEEVLVKAFLSTTDTKLQGYLSFVMQELMDKVDIHAALAMEKLNIQDGDRVYRKWLSLSEDAREVLRPFLGSSYMLAPGKMPIAEYPIFQAGKTYHNWLRAFTLDLLQNGQTPLAQLIFEPLTRVIRVKDLYVAEFLLPYLVLHQIIAKETPEKQRNDAIAELVNILEYEPPEGATYYEREEMKLFYEAVFGVLDYASRWIQEKSRYPIQADAAAMKRVEAVVNMIPSELRSRRAVDCKQYSRALFYLEHHAQEVEVSKGDAKERTRLLGQLQDIYAQIDEPDGLEGLSARLHVLDVNQQILSHKKAGRWSAAQTWYEIKLAEEPTNVDIQVDLLTCLKQSGQHDVLLNYVEGMRVEAASENKIVPFAVEAAWATSRWDTLSTYAGRFHGDVLEDFNVSLAKLFGAMRLGKSGEQTFTTMLESMRNKIASAMTFSATSSLQTCHEMMLRCHVLTDLEIIAGTRAAEGPAHQEVLTRLDRRLEILGAYVNDKQYVLGIRRAAMEISRPKFADLDISSLWLSSARLARKANATHQSLNAILHASKLGDESAVIENARLLWKDGHTRKAIQVLQGAIDSNKFATQVNATGSARGLDSSQRLLTARAQLTLAKWLDAAGQTQILALRTHYQQVPKTLAAWEKGHFFLGRLYKKLMESQEGLPVDDQSDSYVQGELARLVIENYLRSLSYGTKYLYQALPRIMTLWLDLGAQLDQPPEGKTSLSRELHKRRVEQLTILHKFLDKYIVKLPAYMFYTALSQIVARIAHPKPEVFERLTRILVKIVEAYPRQSLWALFGVMTTRQASLRRDRGQKIMATLKGIASKVDGGSLDLKVLIRQGEKLAEQLLFACNNGHFTTNRTMTVSITRDLGFNHKCTPCPLVVPVQKTLSATLPTLTDNIKKHRAFSRDTITIDSFLDEVLVLSSLARPRRLTARGSDGNNYMLMIKPKDDLRTDQRLMEFNGMINRSLKRDAESSRRQLYIRTYAVTPLNEECGIIEWVDGLKTLRDILLEQYRQLGKTPDYMSIKQKMKDATATPESIRIFTEEVLGDFPPRLHHWFIQQFPQPAAWFAARIRYTRSAAVMSMVGTILGLGDRHAENVLLEKDTGGIFHVDFNCLFDKGKTFAEPERVPFRLTHNMVSAMGMHGYEGPFRTCSELTVGILRQQEETLMTILEAFIYDPTLDLQKPKKTGRGAAAPAAGEIRLDPGSVVASIKRKVRGLLPQESIPLSVEGHVEELIKQAVDPRNLSAMYIGWCPFL